MPRIDFELAPEAEQRLRHLAELGVVPLEELLRDAVDAWLERGVVELFHRRAAALEQAVFDHKRELALAIADHQRLRKLVEQESSLAEEWEQRLVSAIEAGDEGLAQRARERFAQQRADAVALAPERDAQARAVDALRLELERAERDLRQLTVRRELLRARLATDEAERSRERLREAKRSVVVLLGSEERPQGEGDAPDP